MEPWKLHSCAAPKCSPRTQGWGLKCNFEAVHTSIQLILLKSTANVLMYSYELKSDNERSVFCILGVFTAVHQARTFLHLLEYFGSIWTFDEVHLKSGFQYGPSAKRSSTLSTKIHIRRKRKEEHQGKKNRSKTEHKRKHSSRIQSWTWYHRQIPGN